MRASRYAELPAAAVRPARSLARGRAEPLPMPAAGAAPANATARTVAAAVAIRDAAAAPAPNPAAATAQAPLPVALPAAPADPVLRAGGAVTASRDRRDPALAVDAEVAPA